MRSIALLLLPLLALAGCVQPAADIDAASALPTGELLAAEVGLWLDPQNAPHPAFGWPTLVHPAADEVAPQWWKAIPNAPAVESITGIEQVAGIGADVSSGAGIALFGSLAVVPGFGEESYTVDISDPTAPKVLGVMEGSHRGAAIIAYPDGRLVAVFSAGGTIDIFDITDPTKPELITQIEDPSHKLGVVPGTPIVYNSAQGIYDLTDPAKPVKVGETGHSCHHIFFWNDPAQSKFRALCAGYAETVLWDTTDPRAPTVVSTVPHFHGNPDLPPASVTPVTFSHTALLNDDGTILVVGDEMGGGAAAACAVHAEAAGVSLSTPTGALWFYDVSDETNPKLLGWFSPEAHPISNPTFAGCTAHHGRLVPDPEGRDLLTMAFYGAGVTLIDFSDPANPWLVDQWNDGTNTWEAWHYNGWIFTGDLNRGLDVLQIV